MAWIRIEDEVTRLERAWDAEVEHWDSSLRAAGSDLLARMDLGRGSARTWTRVFAPWTSLYPLLLSEGLERADLHQATRLNLAHLALLVHAFIDDRRRDGQLQLDVGEEAFSRRCFDLAMERLNDELPDIFPSDPAVRALLEEYEWAQAARWPVSERPITGTEPGMVSRIRRLAHGRAIYGYLAPLALIVAAGVSPKEADQHRRAFEELVTGLQWGDDAQDWKADWMAGRQNLLLSRLADLEPETAAIPRRCEGRHRIEDAISSRGLLDEALDAARRCFEKAAELHASSGCVMLAGMLKMLTLKVERMRGDFVGGGTA